MARMKRTTKENAAKSLGFLVGLGAGLGGTIWATGGVNNFVALFTPFGWLAAIALTTILTTALVGRAFIFRAYTNYGKSSLSSEAFAFENNGQGKIPLLSQPPRTGPIGLILFGNSGVGKTSLRLRYLGSPFPEEHVKRIAVDFGSRTSQSTKKEIFLWDISGQEKFYDIIKEYPKSLPGCSTVGYIVVYDITEKDSFEHVEKWITMIKKRNKNPEIILVGNKCDREDYRKVSIKEGKALADEHSALFIETSAKANIEVNAAFDNLIKKVFPATATPQPAGRTNDELDSSITSPTYS